MKDQPRTTPPRAALPVTAGLGSAAPAWLPAAIAAVLAILPIAYAHRESFRTLVSAHGLLHTAIAQRFADSWVPARPENPFFAGEALPYYWPFHYVGARVAAVLEVHPLYAFELLIFAAIGMLWAAAAVLGHRLYASTAAGVAIGGLALAGTNPFGAGVLLVKIAARGPRFLADDGEHFWGLLHPVFGAARFNDPYGFYGPLLNFFFNITSRPIALALVLVMACALFACLRTPRWRAWAGLAAATAMCTAFSFLIGVVAAAALAGGLVVAAWMSRGAWGRDADGAWRATLAAVAALACGLLAAAPTYYYFFLGTHDQAVRLNARAWTVQGIAFSAFVPMLLASLGARRAGGITRQFLLALTLAGYALIAGSAVFSLPVSNECNLFHAGAFLLAVPAAGGLLDIVRRMPLRPGIVWTALALLFLSTPLVVVYAYLHRPPIALAMDGPLLVRTPRDGPLAHLYDWIRAQTRADAIFIADPATLAMPGGSIPEFPALSGRFLFTGAARDYMVAPHAEAPLRERLARQLLAGDAPDAAQQAYLQRLARPLYLLLTPRSGDERLPRLRERYGEPVFRDDGVVVFSLT